jgi:hypothetical protein
MEKNIRILVCGGRNYADEQFLSKQLDRLVSMIPPWLHVTIVHGAANGADALAEFWARKRKIKTEPHPADWRPNGVLDRGAGPKRNRRMLKTGINVVVAFPGGNGTADMVNITKDAIAKGENILLKDYR